MVHSRVPSLCLSSFCSSPRGGVRPPGSGPPRSGPAPRPAAPGARGGLLGAPVYRMIGQLSFCPARSAGFLNPLTRKIVFVRPASVRASVPYFLIVILQLFTSPSEIDEIVVFSIRSEPQTCDSLLI